MTYNLKDSGKRQKFETGALRDTEEGKGRYDLLPARAIELLAKHFEAGANKYSARNWEKGMPLSRYIDSALRHLFKALEGQKDEPHLVAALWNIACLIDTQERIKEGLLPKELDDLPKRKLKIETIKPKSMKNELKELKAYKKMNEMKLVSENKEMSLLQTKTKFREVVRRLMDIKGQLKTKELNDLPKL